jgi:serine/threonine protein kinase
VLLRAASHDCGRSCAASAGTATLPAQKKVHRDLKPSNILLAARGVVKLCDLGISDSASAGGGGYGGGDGDGAGGTPLEVEDKDTPSIWRQNASLGCSARRSQSLH